MPIFFVRKTCLSKNDIFNLLEKENCERGIVKGSKLPICLFHRTLAPMIIEFLSKVINKSGQFNRKFFLRNFKRAKIFVQSSFTQELEFTSSKISFNRLVNNVMNYTFWILHICAIKIM